MKNTTKKISQVLALILALGSGSVLASCQQRAGGGKSEAIDANRTQLYVSSYGGGFGSSWLYELKGRFELAYKDVCFEPGTDKLGVQIIVDPGEASGSSLTLQTNDNEVIFTENVPYFSWAKGGNLVDISDVVTDVIAQDGVDLSNKQKAALTTVDGNYYALPHYEGYYGITYDKDVFNTKGLYIAQDGSFTNAAGALSVGPDGKTGVIGGVDYSLDDGLPATWEEFFDLCYYMKTIQGVTPIMLAGKVAEAYSMRFLDAICAAYTGEEMSGWYDFTGEIEYVTSTTTDSTDEVSGTLFGYKMNTTTDTIDETTGYLLRQMPGRLVAISVLNKLIKEGYFEQTALLSVTEDQKKGQNDYINSSLRNKPVAMLIDGNWWESEADFTESIAAYPHGYPNGKKSDRHFAYMPLPTKLTAADDNEGDSKTIMEYNRAYAVLNKCALPTWKIALAKDFLRFAYSPESLECYTKVTGTARGLQYNISDAAYNELSSYGQSLWNNHKNGNVVYKLSNNNLYINKETDFSDTWGSGSFRSPFDALRLNNATVLSYYTGTLISESKWHSDYSRYFTINA